MQSAGERIVRVLLDSVNSHNGRTVRTLCSGLGVGREWVSANLAGLEAAAR